MVIFLYLFFFFQISKFDAEKVAQLTTFLVDFLEYIRASQGDQLDHKKVHMTIKVVETFLD